MFRPAARSNLGSTSRWALVSDASRFVFALCCATFLLASCGSRGEGDRKSASVESNPGLAQGTSAKADADPLAAPETAQSGSARKTDARRGVLPQSGGTVVVHGGSGEEPAPQDNTEALSSNSPPDGGAAPAQDPDSQPDPAQAAADLHALINNARIQAGVPALTLDARLTQAAQQHTDDMIARSYFSHTLPEGPSYAWLVARAAFDAQALAENISRGPTHASQVVDSWLADASQRLNVLSSAFSSAGVGLTLIPGSGSYCWALIVATPK